MLSDERVHETSVAEAEAKRLAELMRTEAGRARQKMVMEHQEDIEEMAVFFKKTVGLSKTVSRKVATEAVVRKVN